MASGLKGFPSVPNFIWNPRKIVFFILLLGVAYGAYRYMIKPANRDLAERKTQIEKNLAKLAEFEKAAIAAKDLSKQLEQLQEAIEFFESKLPPKSEIHKVLEQVTVIAQKQGLKPKTIQTLKKQDNSGYIEQPLKMELVGNFNSFYSFLLEIEKLPRIMKIRELELNKKTKDEGQIAAKFIVSIFFQNKTG
jgi:type IV pilus assembly protein PilO